MVKIKLITAITAIAILAGCGSYASTGAYTGATLGSILGSAIGGLTGGPRGSDIGQIVGMGVGGVVGATIGEQADKKVIKGIEKSRDNYDYYNEQGQYYQPAEQNGVINYSNGADDRIFDFKGNDYNGNYSAQQPSTNNDMVQQPFTTNGALPLEIKNARFVDANQDRTINRDELCKVIFEIWNNSNRTWASRPQYMLNSSNQVKQYATLHW